MKIVISGQYGDPKADKIFWPLQKNLNDVFEKYIKNDYFNNIIELSVVFRVSGKITNFKGDGPQRMKYLKKEPSITIDLTFPETVWQGKDIDFIKLHIKEGLMLSFNLMLEKAYKLGEIKDFELIKEDIVLAIEEFMDN